MNFLSLEYFIVVAEELNVTKAAERLFISQQSLSKHMIKLEKEVGAKLFNRTPSFALTYAGKCFLRGAMKLMDIKRRLVMEIDDINHFRRGELRIGVSHTRGRVLLPKVLPQFQRTFPLIDISVQEGNSKQLENLLMHGQIDLLIGFSPIVLDVAETINILQERLFLVVPYDYVHDTFQDQTEKMIQTFQQGVDVSVFKDRPFLLLNSGNRIRTLFDHYLNLSSMSVNVALEMESIETLLSLACEGMGISIYPEMFVRNLSPLVHNHMRNPVNFFPINHEATNGNLVIAYDRERYLSEAAKMFIQICTQQLREFFYGETDDSCSQRTRC